MTLHRAEFPEHKRAYAHEHAATTELLAAIRMLKRSVLIGASARAGAFTQQIIAQMAEQQAQPVIFSLSNPTSKSECTAQEAYEWSHGRALFASGSPFAPVTVGERTFVPRQGNNSYIFPGLGLGVLAVRARRITDSLFLAAARELARQVSAEDLAQGSLYPPLSAIREVSAHIAVAVAEEAFTQRHAGIERPHDLLAHVRSCMYDPSYPDDA